MGRSHAMALRAWSRLTDRAGQGTVEYVALILLVGVVLGAAVAAAGSTKFDLAGTVTKEISDAVKDVSGKAK